MNRQSVAVTGHFLIEFSIFILTVLSVLTVTLLFYYPIYMERAKITEGIILASSIIRTQFSEHYALHGKFPTTLGETVRRTGKYTSHINIDKNAVTATLLLNTEQPALLTFRPALLGDSDYKIIFPVCGYANPPKQAVIYGENQTNIPRSHLPHTCR